MNSRHPAVSCACPKCQSERRTTPTPATEDREAVARAINPDVWASFDGSIRPYAENRGANASTDSAHFYERTWRAGCRTPDDVRHWWLETADAAKESTYVLLLRDSLTKADAALSALAPIRAAEILAAEANERARWADWARVRSALNHRWAAEGEHLRTERIALSSAYAELADAIERGEHGAGK